jgi:hypothetical protein
MASPRHSRSATAGAQLDRRDELLAEQQSEIERLRAESAAQAALLDYFRARAGLHDVEESADGGRSPDTALAAELALCRARLQKTEGDLEVALALVLALRVQECTPGQASEPCRCAPNGIRGHLSS